MGLNVVGLNNRLFSIAVHRYDAHPIIVLPLPDIKSICISKAHLLKLDHIYSAANKDNDYRSDGYYPSVNRSRTSRSLE